jgi:BlaI family penicillinase repressor
MNISDAEWEVMTAVWNRPPLPAAEVVEELGKSKKWSSRTIRTLIDRLVKKGALRVEEEGKRYLYWPKIAREECVRRESQHFLRRVFGGEPAPMLMHLVRETKLTPEEIRQLKAILKEKEK